MKKDLSKKRLKEKQVVETMIKLYCNKNHKTKGGELCPDCKELLDYAHARSDKCPFMENKTFCSACPVHCYSAVMREKIKQVMRFSGPRMLIYHPLLAIWHVTITVKQKKKGANK